MPRRTRALVVLLGAFLIVALFTTVAGAQTSPWRIVQGDDGTLYLLAGGQRFTLQPDPISDDDLAGIPDGGPMGSTLAAPDANPPSAAPTSAPLPATTPVPVLSRPVAPVVSPGVAVGTREHPIPLGTAGTLADGWQLVVISIEPNATKDVVAHDPANAAPRSGTQYFMARIQVTAAGPGPQAFQADRRLRAVGPASVPYLAFANSCGTIPDLIAETQVAQGGTLVGNVCWTVQSKDAAALLLYDAPPVISPDATRLYFALKK